MSIDLGNIATDPDLGASPFWYCRSLESIDAKGRSKKTQNFYQTVGNIQPATGEECELLEEGERQKGAITLYTPTELVAGKETVRADRIYYKGDIYRVSLVESWEAFARFTKVIAVYEGKETDEMYALRVKAQEACNE